jgi:hypothetical protein
MRILWDRGVAGAARRLKTVTTLSTRKKGSTPPGIRIGVKQRGRR